MADITVRGQDSDSHPEILFVISQLIVGGAENHLVMVAPALVRKGWRVSVFSLQGDGPVREKLSLAGVEVTWPALRHEGRSRVVHFALAARDLSKTLRRKRPAIVHFFLPAAYLVGAPLASLARMPVRVMSRRSLNRYQAAYPFVSKIEKMLHRTMSALLGNSLSVVRELHDKEGVPTKKLALIYNGVDAQRFAATSREEARATIAVPSDELVLITVANLIPYKGHADILAALAGLKTALPARWRLLVVGRDDGIGADLKNLAEERGIASHIDFLGSRSDVPLLLAAADIGLLCSHEEGFSNSLLEGMAAGLPMVATDVGGVREAMTHLENGIIVPARDVARLADAVQKLAHDPSLRKKLGTAARARVVRDFSVERCVEAYEALYRGLIAGRQPCDVSQVSVARRF